MNSKIKNYVDLLFNDIAKTSKALELKEEILFNLNEHFEEGIKAGKSENQAYTDAIQSLGNIDELLAGLIPGKDTQKEINLYLKKRAKFYCASVALYILSLLVLIVPAGFFAVVGKENLVPVAGIIGFGLFIFFVAVATILIVYINMSVSQEVKPYLEKKNFESCEETGSSNWKDALLNAYWLLVCAIYFLISFSTGEWGISWIIWIFAAGLRKLLIAFCKG